MEAFFQVQSGIYKNRRFKFPVSGRGHMNFTPSILKKAVFDMIEADALTGLYLLEELVFVDLFAGSGQVGIEALSRGFGKVHLLEIDKIRFGSIKKMIQDLKNNCIQIHNKDGFRYFNLFESGENGVLFLDPPYTFWEGKKLHVLLEELNKIDNVKRIFVQSPIILHHENSRKFGSNFLTEIKTEL